MSRTTAQAQASEQKPIKLDFGSFTSSAGRQKNEDRVEVRRGKLQIAMCADGMGGGVLGAAMSDVAVRTVYEFLESQPFSDPPALLEQAFDKANAAMIKLMGASKLAANSGSTLICAVLQRTPGGLIVHMGSVGDTRAYLVGTDGKLSQMNRDHSYYEQLIDQGLTPAEARQDKNARKLTFSLGSDFMIRDVPYFYSKHRIGPGESMLLCTDGVSEFVDPNDIARIIKGQPADKAAQQIVQKAYTNKTTDNASAVVVRYDNTSAFALPMRRAAQIGGALLVVGALAFGISSAIGQEPETIVVDGQTVTITPLPADVTGEPTSTFAAGPGQATSTRIPTATPTPPPTDTPVIIIPTTPPQATPRPGQPTTRPATARPTQPNTPPTQAPNNPNPQPVPPTQAPNNPNPQPVPPTEPPATNPDPGPGNNPRPTNTPRPPTDTPVIPLPTVTLPPVLPTNTPVPPTNTPAPPTNTPVPPTPTTAPQPPTSGPCDVRTNPGCAP